MTTTDPTPLAEQIAREHWLDAHDECGTCRVGDYAAHIATVTERAVRKRVATAVAAIQPPDETDRLHGSADYWEGATDAHEWWQAKAARITTGAPDA